MIRGEWRSPARTTDDLDAIWFQTDLDRFPLFIAPLVIGVHHHFRDGRIGIMEARTASARSRGSPLQIATEFASLKSATNDAGNWARRSGGASDAATTV